MWHFLANEMWGDVCWGFLGKIFSPARRSLTSLFTKVPWATLCVPAVSCLSPPDTSLPCYVTLNKAPNQSELLNLWKGNCSTHRHRRAVGIKRNGVSSGSSRVPGQGSSWWVTFILEPAKSSEDRLPCSLFWVDRPSISPVQNGQNHSRGGLLGAHRAQTPLAPQKHTAARGPFPVEEGGGQAGPRGAVWLRGWSPLDFIFPLPTSAINPHTWQVHRAFTDDAHLIFTISWSGPYYPTSFWGETEFRDRGDLSKVTHLLRTKTRPSS